LSVATGFWREWVFIGCDNIARLGNFLLDQVFFRPNKVVANTVAHLHVESCRVLPFLLLCPSHFLFVFRSFEIFAIEYASR
jgi:hypothetical protein